MKQFLRLQVDHLILAAFILIIQLCTSRDVFFVPANLEVVFFAGLPVAGALPFLGDVPSFRVRLTITMCSEFIRLTVLYIIYILAF